MTEESPQLSVKKKNQSFCCTRSISVKVLESYQLYSSVLNALHGTETVNCKYAAFFKM